MPKSLRGWMAYEFPKISSCLIRKCQQSSRVHRGVGQSAPALQSLIQHMAYCCALHFPQVAIATPCSGAVLRPKPPAFALARDGTARLADLRWRHWGFAAAQESRTHLANSCVPGCAAGKIMSYIAQVTPSDPVYAVTTRDMWYWQSLRITFPDGGPDHEHLLSDDLVPKES